MPKKKVKKKRRMTDHQTASPNGADRSATKSSEEVPFDVPKPRKRGLGAKPPKQKKSTRLKKQRLSSAEAITDVTSLRQYFDIPNDGWDVLIICDGSGTSWGKEWGSGSVIVQRSDFARPMFQVGGNTGTNNVAELMGVFYPLLWLTTNKFGVAEGGCRVHVISDSEYVVNGINNDAFLTARKFNKNQVLWLSIHATKRQGIVLKAHHIKRDTIDLNKLCHDLANLARKSQINLQDGLQWDPVECNPE